MTALICCVGGNSSSHAVETALGAIVVMFLGVGLVFLIALLRMRIRINKRFRDTSSEDDTTT
jgi:Na+-transporting methylmalonyl-CoA/oxaloacetate decarboxylase gamma subunit